MATGSQSLYIGSDEIPSHDCDVCLSNHKTVEAISYCTTCCEYLCKPCELSHRGSRALRSHTILTGSDIPPGTTGTKPMLPFMFCDTHKTTLLNIYCTTHDVVICPTCKIASHKTCDTGDVSRHSARLDVESEIQKVSKRLRVLTTTYEDLTKNRHIDRSTVKIQLQKCLSDMRQFRKNINDKLDEEKKNISSEIRCIEETMTKEIDEHEIFADDSLRHIGDLVNSLSECQKTRENDVMFVGLKKAACRANEYGYIHSNINKDIYPIDIRFQPNDVLADMIQHLQSVGTIFTNRPMDTGHGQTSILNISVTDKQEIDVKSKRVTGCTCMSDGQLVLACHSDGLKLFDNNFNFKSKSSVIAVDVSAINATDVIVTQGGPKQLQCVRVHPDMVVKKTLKTDRNCFGIDVHGDEIYVTCHDCPGNGEVRVLNTDGVVLRMFGVDNGTYMCTSPGRVRVNRDGSKVFVSDWGTDIVTCVNNQGQVIYQYSDRDLKGPCGMYIDG